jgi:hypothetical protein
MKLFLFALTGLLFWVEGSYAKKFEGYKPPMRTVFATETAYVVKLIDAGDAMLIGIADHAALFKFPKKSYSSELKTALELSKKDKKPIEVIYNAATAEVIFLNTEPPK